METKANYVAVGGFVLTSMLLLVIALLWLSGLQYNREFSYYQTNFIGAVTGLAKGTTVRYNGIEVGRVNELKFDPNDPQVVIVTLQVQSNLGIRTDSVVSIESVGLTGGSYIEIMGGKKQAPLLVPQDGQEYAIIKSKQSTLQQLAKTAPQLIEELNQAAEKISLILSKKNQDAFAHILENLERTTSVLAERSGDIDSTLVNVSAAAKALPDTVADADAAANKIGQLAADSDDFVKGGGLAQIDGLIADTRRLVVSLGKLSDQLNRQPTKLLFGDRRKGYTPK